jgi:hypothetical protein
MEGGEEGRRKEGGRARARKGRAALAESSVQGLTKLQSICWPEARCGAENL